MAEKIEGFYLNGTEYEIGGAEYNAGEGISIGDVSMNARKGPSPDGFHMSSIAEWEGLRTIMNGLGLTTGDNRRINLHMPFVGYRDNTSNLNSQDSIGNYWSSSPYDSSRPGNARYLRLNSSSITITYSSRARAVSVRCFKDSYVTPTDSWTVVQGTLGSAGIFWNQTDGLISITSDGTTGYTIQDKNLGATTVYNNGDTLTQANMGNMYQWGNNYGFPSTGTISKTSSTQVDASGYGPSTTNGYYESDTFITGSNDWSSVQNDDLWGDSTGTIAQENVINNTGVLSVNGQTGDVTIQTGGNYTAGTGIDITNDEIGLDGTYDKTIIHSDMQGPAPEGFHVPLSTEWQAIYDAYTGLGLSGSTNFATYLKLPMAGQRDFSNLSFLGRDSNGNYWSSTPKSTNNSYYLLVSSSNFDPQGNTNRTNGQSIRCIKDSPVVPTSSWTTLYQGSGSAGIYHNATDGLISISSNGSTWYTIADKNLGATTVYNYGDVLTESNGGKVYQRGNNYGFSGDANYDVSQISKSSTKVNVTGYGPGNYYESSTWITSNRWQDSASDGYNLWGGISQGNWTSQIDGSLVLGDKLYKIVTSTTAPASGTANNIITISTGSTKGLYVGTTKIA